MAHYDVVILGAGPGGYLAAERLAAEKLKVALIEKTDVCGTCLNIGCVPTKTFLNSAKLYAHAREGTAFGVETDGVRVNWPRVVAWKDEVVTRLRRSLELTLKKGGVEIVRGQGKLTGAHSVAVENGTPEPAILDADSIIIATGSSPIIPPIPGVKGNRRSSTRPACSRAGNSSEALHHWGRRDRRRVREPLLFPWREGHRHRDDG